MAKTLQFSVKLLFVDFFRFFVFGALNANSIDRLRYQRAMMNGMAYMATQDTTIIRLMKMEFYVDMAMPKKNI